MNAYRKHKNWRRMFGKKAETVGPKANAGVILPDHAFDGPAAIPPVDDYLSNHEVWALAKVGNKAHKVQVQVNNLSDVRYGKVIQDYMVPVGTCLTGKKVDWVGKKIVSGTFEDTLCASCAKLPKSALS